MRETPLGLPLCLCGRYAHAFGSSTSVDKRTSLGTPALAVAKSFNAEGAEEKPQRSQKRTGNKSKLCTGRYVSVGVSELQVLIGSPIAIV